MASALLAWDTLRNRFERAADEFRYLYHFIRFSPASEQAVLHDDNVPPLCLQRGRVTPYWVRPFDGLDLYPIVGKVQTYLGVSRPAASDREAIVYAAQFYWRDERVVADDGRMIDNAVNCWNELAVELSPLVQEMFTSLPPALRADELIDITSVTANSNERWMLALHRLGAECLVGGPCAARLCIGGTPGTPDELRRCCSFLQPNVFLASLQAMNLLRDSVSVGVRDADGRPDISRDYAPWPIEPEFRAKCVKAVRDVLNNKSVKDSLRVGAGMSLLYFIGNEVNPGKGELPNPTKHEETAAAWAAMHDPLQRLAALAESKGLDSTLLRGVYYARYYSELDQVRPLIERLELIECGPQTGETAELFAKVRGMIADRTDRTAPATVSRELLAKYDAGIAAVAKPVLSVGTRDDHNGKPRAKDRVYKPAGWTKKELVDEAKEQTSFSATVFDEIRKQTDVKAAEKGGKGQQRKYSKADLRKLIDAVEAGTFRYRVQIAAAWRGLLGE